MSFVSIANWFNENYTYEQQVQLRKKYVPRPESYQDTNDRIECSHCDGTGRCSNCDGDGNFDHVCDCEFCDIITEPCEDCSETGKCYPCKGTGWETEFT